jgi:hypothetical protein
MTNDETKSRITEIHKDVLLIKELLTGNGEPSKGVIVRLDRLEQSRDNQKWTIRACVVASLSALAGVFAHRWGAK